MTDHTVTTTTFCDIVGIAVPRFRSLRQRGHLPLMPAGEEEDDAAGWTRFTPTDALLMRCAFELADANGLAFADASLVVRNSEGVAAFLDDGALPTEFWLWSAEFRDTHGDGGEIWRSRGHARGDLPELRQWLRRNPDDQPSRIFLVNVAAAWAVLSRRASERGYVLTPDAFTPRSR